MFKYIIKFTTSLNILDIKGILLIYIDYIFKYNTSINILHLQICLTVNNVSNSTLYACDTSFGYQRYVTDLSPIFKSDYHECMNTK